LLEEFSERYPSYKGAVLTEITKMLFLQRCCSYKDAVLTKMLFWQRCCSDRDAVLTKMLFWQRYRSDIFTGNETALLDEYKDAVLTEISFWQGAILWNDFYRREQINGLIIWNILSLLISVKILLNTFINFLSQANFLYILYFWT